MFLSINIIIFSSNRAQETLDIQISVAGSKVGGLTMNMYGQKIRTSGLALLYIYLSHMHNGRKRAVRADD